MSTRTLVDQPDDYMGAQVKVIYAVPRGAVEHQLDLTSKIPYSLAAMNNWLQAQIGRKIKFDTFWGDLDITYVQLPRTDAEYQQSVKSAVIGSDLSNLQVPGKNLLIYYEGGDPTICGESTLPIGELDRQAAIVYLHGANGACETYPMASGPQAAPSFTDLTPFHELFHSFGALHPAPIDRAPTLDEYYRHVCDLMYAPKTVYCTSFYLDPYHLYYYKPDGRFTGRLNTYDSSFLTPPPTR